MNKIDLNGYVAISLEDYAEYQELKKPKIDYSKLKTGSVVKIRYSVQHCNGIQNIDLDKTLDLVFYKSKFVIDKHKEFKEYTAIGSYTTFHQCGNYVVFYNHEKIDYITEVISY